MEDWPVHWRAERIEKINKALDLRNVKKAAQKLEGKAYLMIARFFWVIQATQANLAP